MSFKDETARESIDLHENLLFYVVSAIIMKNESTMKTTKMRIFKFLMVQKSVFDREKLVAIFREQMNELSIEYNNGFRFNQVRHARLSFSIFKNRSLSVST